MLSKDIQRVKHPGGAKREKAVVKVPQPVCFLTYNQNTGSMGLHDLHVSRYRSAMRSKKWWWPILPGPFTVQW